MIIRGEIDELTLEPYEKPRYACRTVYQAVSNNGRWKSRYVGGHGAARILARDAGYASDHYTIVSLIAGDIHDDEFIAWVSDDYRHRSTPIRYLRRMYDYKRSLFNELSWAEHDRAMAEYL